MLPQFRHVSLVFFACLLTLETGAQLVAAKPQPFTAADVMRVRSVASAAMSPDGQRVAILRRVPRVPAREPDGPAWSELHVVDVASGASTPFVTGAVTVRSVDWRPDGRAISFIAKFAGDEHDALYAIAVAGGQAAKLVAHDEDIASYDWSPDGARVAFIAAAPESPDKKSRKKQGFDALAFEEDVRNKAAYLVDVPAQPVASSPTPQPIEIAGSAIAVRWSPDGRRIAVRFARNSLIDEEMMFSRIAIFDANRERVGQVESIGKLGAFEFSPDGQQIAFIGVEDLHDPREGRLMVASADGGAAKNLLPGYMGHVAGIGWIDKNTAAYVGQEGVWSTFGRVDIDGTNAKTIVPTGGPVLNQLSLASDGQSVAFVAESPTHPEELYTMRHGDAAPRRLTDSNPWLALREFPVQRVEKFKARDGLELEGILIEPLGRADGQSYPLVMIVHGGPEAHESNGFFLSHSRPAYVFAANGFAVFLPNYRGSTGRGVQFSQLGQRDYAGAEFDDLVDAVDHLVSVGLVDAKRVGVTGGSYGGYASAWCATRFSPRFAAAVMSVGLSDKISAWGTTDIPREMYLVHARAWPWDQWEFYQERSPISYTINARTPILIVHGQRDTRVHPSQSLTMYRYLKLHNQTPTRLVLYPQEGHGNQNAAARWDYLLRLLQWMDHYLKGPGGAPPPHELNLRLEEFAADPVADPTAKPD